MFCEGNAEFSPTYDLSRFFYGYGQRTAESAYEPVLDFFSLDKKDVFKVRLIDGKKILSYGIFLVDREF
jgi:hypothetical protein